MVEFAVAVQSVRDLPVTTAPWTPFAHQNNVEAELQTLFFEEWSAQFGGLVKPGRLYFGSEFCQYRLAPLSAVKKALAFCRENGLTFTFATPFVHQDQFHRLAELLSFLNDAGPCSGKRIEVVVNDWGVYHHIRTHFSNLDVVIGRLLNKMIRDPRVAHHYDNERAPESAREFFKQPGLLSTWFTRFLEGGNVVGFDFDQLIQGTDVSDSVSPLIASLHFPYGCVASGSACLVGFMDTPKSDKFRGDPNCKQQCQSYVFELTNRRHTDMEHRVFQKGTTAFYAHKTATIKQGLRSMQSLTSPRVVFSPRIPM